jgi:hypothetical protein
VGGWLVVVGLVVVRWWWLGFEAWSRFLGTYLVIRPRRKADNDPRCFLLSQRRKPMGGAEEKQFSAEVVIDRSRCKGKDSRGTHVTYMYVCFRSGPRTRDVLCCRCAVLCCVLQLYCAVMYCAV